MALSNPLPGSMGCHAPHFAPLSKRRGWALLAHELYHVQQYLDRGYLRMLITYAGGILRSLPAMSLWDHGSIPMEQEAAEVQHQAFSYFEQKPDSFFERYV